MPVKNKMDNIANFHLFEKTILQGGDMKSRAELLQKIIQTKLEPEDVINPEKFDFKDWSQKMKELKKIYLRKKFTLTDALNLLYVEPAYLPAFIKFKGQKPPKKSKGQEQKKQEKPKPESKK
jgi:hypothetical protein